MQDSRRDTVIKNRLLDSMEGKGGIIWENSIETCILSYVKQIASPGSMHETVLRAGALGWPRGMRWRVGFRMGNTCTPMADSCQCMAKPPQYYKVISLQLNKLKKEKWGELVVRCPLALTYSLKYWFRQLVFECYWHSRAFKCAVSQSANVRCNPHE